MATKLKSLCLLRVQPDIPTHHSILKSVFPLTHVTHNAQMSTSFFFLLLLFLITIFSISSHKCCYTFRPRHFQDMKCLFILPPTRKNDSYFESKDISSAVSHKVMPVSFQVTFSWLPLFPLYYLFATVDVNQGSKTILRFIMI